MAGVEKISFLKALIYADIFDYPLNRKEIYLWLIRSGERKIKRDRTIKNSGIVRHQKGFYFLKGRKKIVALRRLREAWSRKKIEIAKKIALWLRIIPFIKLVGISGSLAMKNSDQDDDIDFLIITKKNRLWITRGLVTIMLDLLGIRRRFGEKIAKDRVCLNMFLGEDSLAVPENEQDLYSAHELVQLQPVWDKDGIYKKFLSENLWVKNYLPNALNDKLKNTDFRLKKTRLGIFLRLLTYISRFIFLFFDFDFWELFAYRSQRWFMKSHRTSEIIEPGRIRFHPHDCRKFVLERYKQKLTALGIKHEA